MSTLMNVWIVMFALMIGAAFAVPFNSDVNKYASNFQLTGRDAGPWDWEHRLSGGHSVKRLIIWATGGSGGYIYGMRALFTDGTWTLTKGKENGTPFTLNLADGELITQCLMWDTSDHQLARIEILTSSGQTIFAGREQQSLYCFYCVVETTVGSGVLAGFGGYHSGTKIEGGGLLMYKPIKSADITNVQYIAPPTSGDQWGFSPMAIDEVVFRPTSANAKWRFAGKLTRHETHTWSSKVTETYGVTVTVSAEFFIVKVEAQAQWNRETITQSSSAITTELDLEWDMSGTAVANSSGIIPPFKCTAKVFTAQLDLRWTGQLSISFEDGTLLTTPMKGLYNNIVYSRVDAACVNL